MSLDGSGGYSLPAGQPVVTGTTISSTTHNTLASDLDTALDTAFYRDGQATATANTNWGGFRLTNIAAATAVTDAARASQVQNSSFTTLTSVSGTNTVVGTATPTPSAYAVGQRFTLTPAVTNTGAATLNVSGLGAGAIQMGGSALTGGELTASFPVEVLVSAVTPVFQIVANGKQLPTVGSAGSIPMSRAAAGSGIAYVAALKSAIYGFTYANAAGDVTNDIDIAAGGAMDATGAYWITGAASTKQLDAAWAVGSAAGGLDTGAIGNSDYYIWAIARSDTGVVDYLFSLSSTAPTMPTNYDFKRLIGWIKRVGAAIVLFHAYETAGGGLKMNWDAPTLDINLANTLTTARRTDAIKVPLNFSVDAQINVVINDSVASIVWVYCPDQTDAAPSATVAPLSNIALVVASTPQATEMHIRTSATGTIAARSTVATTDLYAVVTIGFIWARRN